VLSQELKLLESLDTFCNHAQIEAVPHANDGNDDASIVRVSGQTAYK
jgi:hypothetical protein